MNWAERDLAHIWHPCSQMKDYEQFPPLEIIGAAGSRVHLRDGRRLIDAMASWWCKSLGHRHPALVAALKQQLDTVEHVLLANTTNATIIELSERLCALTPNLNKVLYASDGSCAVEMALKMSLHVRQIRGERSRTQLMALRGAHHGETALALAVSDLGRFREPYEAVLPTAHFLEGLSYVQSTTDPLWQDCSTVWPAIEKQLAPHAETLTAIIVEPVLQGANEMRFYSKDLLKRLRQWTQANNIHLIADEVFTGFYRTGPALACQHAGIDPDFLCLAKGLTAGMLPMSAMLTTDPIYQCFYDDYEKGKSFFHSHTHTGNVLAAAVALATLKVYEEENIEARVARLQVQMRDAMLDVAERTQRLTNVRSLGAMVAADLTDAGDQRLGYAVYRKAVELGALLRPIGNTLYWVPPLNIEPETIQELQNVTCESILQTV